MSQPETRRHPRSGARHAAPTIPRALLALLVVAVFVTLVPAAMVNVVLAVIARDFSVTDTQAAWVVTGNLLAISVTVPLGGRAADVFGIRTSFLVAFGSFILGTATCLVAPNLLALVAGRVLQGVGEGVLPALAVVTVARVLHPGHRGRALGLVFAGAGIGATIGPIIGGLAEEVVGWRAPFAGILLAATAVLPFAIRLLPDLRLPRERHIDLIGGLLMGFSVGMALLAVTVGAQRGFSARPVWALFAASLLAVPALVRRLRVARHPLIRPELLSNRDFTRAAVVGFTAQGVNVTVSVLVPLVLIQDGAFSPGQIAAVLAPGPVTAAVLSPISGRLSDRFGFRPPIAVGLALMLGATLWLTTVPVGTAPDLATVGILLLGAGFGLVNAPTTNLAIRGVGQDHTGGGIGVYQSAYFLGGAVGPVLAGTFIAARLHSGTGTALNPLALGLSLRGAAYSDAFLLLAVPLVIAVGVALRAPAGRPADPLDPPPSPMPVDDLAHRAGGHGGRTVERAARNARSTEAWPVSGGRWSGRAW